MTTTDKKPVTSSPSDRRSSVRVRSLLPLGWRRVDADEMSALEARILDMAVIESDGIAHDAVDWSERSEELPREVVFVLNELRALRQQLTELQRLVERQGKVAAAPRWVELNTGGLWVPLEDGDPDWKVGDFMEVRLQIPSTYTPEILAAGEAIRVDEEGRRGVAIEFRSISQLHKKAIMRYALRRERQLARSHPFGA